MKDLVFSTGGNVIGTLRVDSISSENNITVMETYGLDDRQEDETLSAVQVALSSQFKKTETSLQEATAFAEANSLTLVVEDVAKKEADITLATE